MRRRSELGIRIFDLISQPNLIFYGSNMQGNPVCVVGLRLRNIFRINYNRGKSKQTFEHEHMTPTFTTTCSILY